MRYTSRASIAALGWRALWLAAAVVPVALAGCVAAQQPARPLPDFEPSTIHDVERARAALNAADHARQEFERRWREREIECYRRTLVNSCLADVSAERREGEQRIRGVESAARAVLRADDARRRNETEAQRLERSAADDAQAAQRRDQARRDQQEREARAAQREAERSAEDAKRQANAREARARLAEKERELERRSEQADERRRAEQRNAAAYAERIRKHRQAERERLERLQERLDAVQKRRAEQSHANAPARPPQGVPAGPGGSSDGGASASGAGSRATPGK